LRISTNGSEGGCEPVRRRAAGCPISQFHAQIAAIALCHGDRLATRSQSDFEGCGITLVDPWAFGG
jgi:hypothetical protein